jgi:lysophospholipase L1-like esterase
MRTPLRNRGFQPVQTVRESRRTAFAPRARGLNARATRSSWRLVLVISIIALFDAPAAPAQTQPASRPWFQTPQIPIDPKLPTLWIIGDSTVRNGRDNGNNGQWGWGNPIALYFDLKRINVQNRAVGGTSSRTFMRDHWPWILEELKPGDFLIMQFGHNDSGPINDTSRARGTLKGIGEETEEIDNLITKQHETVHTYGWYIRQYVTDAREHGVAYCIALSITPTNRWSEGTIRRDPYGPWAEEAAKQVGGHYIDLNRLAVAKYEAIGREKVTELYFPENEVGHTCWAGAVLNAECVIEGMKSLRNCPLVPYLLTEPPKDLKPPMGRAR